MAGETVTVETTPSTVRVFERDGTEHITTPSQIENKGWEIEDGYVVPPEDHTCPECNDL